MANEIKDGLWATDDGSYGSGTIVVVDSSKWSAEQWSWYEKLTDSGEVYFDQLKQIDEGVNPEGDVE